MLKAGASALMDLYEGTSLGLLLQVRVSWGQGWRQRVVLSGSM